MEVATRYVRRPGHRDGETVLIDLEGFWVWHINGNQRFRCTRYISGYCRTILHQVGVESYTQIGEHNHENDRQKILNMEAENWCKEQARVSARRIHAIYVDATERFPEFNVMFYSIQRTLQRVRSSIQPTIPQNFDEADELLQGNVIYRMSTGGLNQFYFGTVTTGGDSAMIFINVAVLNKLVDAQEIHMDGTFKTVPRIFYQMASLHAIAFGYAIPVAYFLMTSKTQNLYESALNRVLQICQERQGRLPTPLRMVSDFEIAILQALATTFPTGVARGCWFHSAMAIYRYACRIGLGAEYRNNDAIKKIVRMMIALALLPSNLLEDGFATVETYMAQVNGNLNLQTRIALTEFAAYVRSFWLERVGAVRFCVWMDVHRTNNCVEAWHRRLNQMMGTSHLNFWLFTKILQSVSNLAVRELAGIIDGRILRAPRRREYVDRDNQIRDAQDRLQTGRITLEEFLTLAANYFIPMIQIQIERVEVEPVFPLINQQNILNEHAAFEVLLPLPALPVNELHQHGPPPLIPLEGNEERIVLIEPDVAVAVDRVRGRGRRGRPRGRAAARRPHGRDLGRGRGRRGQHANGNVIYVPPVYGMDLLEEDQLREQQNEIIDFQLNRPDLARLENAINVEEANRLPIEENAAMENNFIDVEIELVNACIVCVARESNRRLDCCVHEFCEQCVRSLRLMNPPNVCPLCRGNFVLAIPI